jgi:hypothetical protein
LELTETFSTGRLMSLRPAMTSDHLARGAQKKMVLRAVAEVKASARAEQERKSSEGDGLGACRGREGELGQMAGQSDRTKSERYGPAGWFMNCWNLEPPTEAGDPEGQVRPEGERRDRTRGRAQGHGKGVSRKSRGEAAAFAETHAERQH